MSKGIDYGKRYIDFSVTKSWLSDQFLELSTAALPGDKTFGDSCGLQRYNTHSSTVESKCNNRSATAVSLKRSIDSVENYSSDWETNLLCSSSSASPSPSQFHTKTTNIGIFYA